MIGDTQYRVSVLILGSFGLLVLVLLVWVNTWRYDVAVRSHNLEVFYKSLTCDDLPIGHGSKTAACEQAIGEYVLPQMGLFTR